MATVAECVENNMPSCSRYCLWYAGTGLAYLMLLALDKINSEMRLSVALYYYMYGSIGGTGMMDCVLYNKFASKFSGPV